MTVGPTSSTAYHYDSLNRLTQITDPAGGITTFGYDQTSKTTSRATANGVTATYQYDGLDRLTRLTHARGAATVADYQYQQNAAGQITQITEPAGTHAYTYDAVDRLTSATHPAQAAESYTYDGVGNRTASHRATTYSYQPFNKTVTVGATTYAYDLNGNLTSKTDAAGTTLYAWDYENRLTQVTRPDGVSVSYKYDALGRRIERSKSDGTWTRYSYDGADVVLDRLSDGATVEYLNGLGIDDKLWQRTNGESPLYFVEDHLGSTRALTDASGNVVENQQYDAFGDGAGSLLTRYGYTGRERDADTGLYYYRARWYDPQQGRFISEDPIGLRGGVNLYGYVENNPVSFTDPTGLQKYKGNLDDLCDTDDCEELLKDIGILELSLHERDFLERMRFGGRVDPGHEQRIGNEFDKLKKCYAKYWAKCRGRDDCPPRIIPMRRRNVETQLERDLQRESVRRRNIAIGAGAAGAVAVAGVVGGGAVVATIVRVGVRLAFGH